jgi:hypothetical protein
LWSDGESLSGIPSFNDFLVERVSKDEEGLLKFWRELLNISTSNVPRRFRAVILGLKEPGSGESLSVEFVILQMEQIFNSRLARNQQDSQEFLHMLHEALVLEIENLNKMLPHRQLLSPENPFEGGLTTSLSCAQPQCHLHTSPREEKFTELSLPLPAKVVSFASGF